MYGAEFAADPHGVYREMRGSGAQVPVELAPGVAATLVIGHAAALRVLRDPEHFPADARNWEQALAPGCPVPARMRWRPTLRHCDGDAHTRYRGAVADVLAEVDLHLLHRTVVNIAVPQINSFCAAGAADLVSEYAAPVTRAALEVVLGLPPDLGTRLVDAPEEMTGLLAAKRADPGDDVLTRLLTHSAALTDLEILEQAAELYRSAMEPLRDLIANTLLLTLIDDRFHADYLGGALTTRAALEEILRTDPPVATGALTYPGQPVQIDGTWLPAHQPVLIGIAACNADPTSGSAAYAGTRAHLAWGSGPHACPAAAQAQLIAEVAIDQLLDALPDLSLAIAPEYLSWRRDPFHRALTALPVVFPESPPLHI
ncbi:cytochrome P450 [Nocardia panacis]|uniref:Cytochrome P450 n=1 Tax=Nocardia panacis TaxID=2340916 RepID=A0A3A4K8N0_9NOCA|nr:cytochrome P450 [Nocardia panacis]